MESIVDKRDDAGGGHSRTIIGTQRVAVRHERRSASQRAPAAFRVLLIDGDSFVASSLRQAMSARSGELRVVDSIVEGRAKIEPAYWSARPADLVVLEVDLRDGDGRALLQHLTRVSPRPAICVVGNRLTTDDYVRVGVFTHPKPVADWQMLVERVHERHVFGVAVTVAEFAHIHGLSNRERMLLEFVANGTPAKEVSVRLNVKPSTIATMWQRIFRRTGMRAQSEVLAAVLRLGACS